MTEAYIEGKVDVNNRELCKLLKEHNELVRHQNTILSNLYELMRARL